MSMISAVTLGFGLSMDAFAAAIGQGACISKAVRLKRAFFIGLAFGLAQGFMPLLGWALGAAFHSWFEVVDHWLALVLLAFLGIRMMKGEQKSASPTLHGKELFMLSLATSIDAAVAGITLSLLGIPILLACAIIAGITFVLSMLGAWLGCVVGARFGTIANKAGGLILIGLGCKIFIEHQFLS